LLLAALFDRLQYQFERVWTQPKIPAEGVIQYDDSKDYEGDASRQCRNGTCV
jgi:hypothetical protein